MIKTRISKKTSGFKLKYAQDMFVKGYPPGGKPSQWRTYTIRYVWIYKYILYYNKMNTKWSNYFFVKLCINLVINRFGDVSLFSYWFLWVLKVIHVDIGTFKSQFKSYPRQFSYVRKPSSYLTESRFSIQLYTCHGVFLPLTSRKVARLPKQLVRC